MTGLGGEEPAPEETTVSPEETAKQFELLEPVLALLQSISAGDERAVLTQSNEYVSRLAKARAAADAIPGAHMSEEQQLELIEKLHAQLERKEALVERQIRTIESLSKS
eukprot:CAMPEP_0114621360 /NCGR_PEP_ID=MMETSP0168-20121206/9190_1 /TAXON_ID=95228 ORGANISM="Vannella sp., Strain DIVA3 517/6/12" /NCGR_SAMPLE_ID=MMETSP0168 /ASSEMBLY_ACC=CAM_ASM_000044 /LENGTH=108 /DNA_ID=CAMNT_0001832559 /DNA_START=9 /DNA_END=335 /DNA_ORIENTATION=+